MIHYHIKYLMDQMIIGGIKTFMESIVIGVIGADVHAVGNRIIDYVLTNAGYNVINIGVLSSQEDFINAAIEANAKMILVSSLYGHGEIDCRGMREKCIEAGLDNILLYVGGNIVVGKQDFTEVEKRFKAMGFNRVFPPGTPIEDSLSLIKADLEAV
jgi:methylaspartate mutase sigma subunit